MPRTHARFLTVTLSLAAAASLACRPASAQDAPHTPRFDFKGKLLVVACDADMLPSAYADGKLGPAVGSDVLAVIRLNQSPDQPLSRLHAATVEVTNSVTGPPAAVAVTPDGRYAIVAETQGPRPAGKPDALLKNLAPGRKLTVVDLSDPDKPVVTQQIDSFERAVSVAVNPAGTLVAVTFAPEAHTNVPLVLFRFRNGKLLDPSQPALPGYTATDELSDAEFLPGKDVLGVVFTAAPHARLSLLQIADRQGQLTLSPWGNEINIDPSPYIVKFTADGRFALVNSMHEFVDGRGTVTSIRLAASADPQGAPQHVIASRAEAGRFPEGLAISPNGRWVATANLENSYLPLNDPNQQFFASLSLLRLDPATGLLDRIGDFPFDGLLPEPLVFDNSSRFIAAGSFGRYDDPKAGGSINFWRIVDRNPQPGRVELIHLSDSVPVPRGPQSMAIVR